MGLASNRNLGDGSISHQSFTSVFCWHVSDSPFPNIMRVVEMHGTFHGGIGFGVRLNAGNYGWMDSLVG